MNQTNFFFPPIFLKVPTRVTLLLQCKKNNLQRLCQISYVLENHGLRDNSEILLETADQQTDFMEEEAENILNISGGKNVV